MCVRFVDVSMTIVVFSMLIKWITSNLVLYLVEEACKYCTFYRDNKKKLTICVVAKLEFVANVKQ